MNPGLYGPALLEAGAHETRKGVGEPNEVVCILQEATRTHPVKSAPVAAKAGSAESKRWSEASTRTARRFSGT